ncbi:WXG100 family type VII secretion target [Saccharomonospora cyanea]|uniref:DUF6973 domain-containing protein n=1 Tax=Saccharomonospora cyanea NA-134 TaxID=882082 RepID=H5XGS5_9PSEU|nr:hypothetical protein [Saccharomonospora cyanea]EHR61618.1 hypothetical protein SaccyDRAFT_2772 [Saccharomonospora cyanea NA-134]
MGQLPESELHSLAKRLHDWSGEVTADNVATVLSSAVTATAEIPGDPDGIEDLGVACGRAADDLDSAAESLTPIVGRLREAWEGEAADKAVERVETEREATETEAETLRTTARVLTALADATRDAHKRHSGLHGHLADLSNRAAALTGEEPEAADLADQAATTLREAADVYSALHQNTADATKNLSTVLYGGVALSELVGETPRGRRSLEEILRQYQVAGSASPQVKFPPPDLADIINPILEKFGKEIPSSNWNAEELELFRQLRPDEMYTWYRVQQEAYVVSEERFPHLEHTTHSHTDAFRHAYWNARMTQEFGEEWAEAFATSHERRATNDMQSEAMDLHNNELGRQIAVQNPDASPEELAELVNAAVNRGDTIVLDGEGRIAYSDQVAHNQTVDPEQHDESVIDHDGALDTDFEGVRPKGGYPW